MTVFVDPGPTVGGVARELRSAAAALSNRLLPCP